MNEHRRFKNFNRMMKTRALTIRAQKKKKKINFAIKQLESSYFGKSNLTHFALLISFCLCIIVSLLLGTHQLSSIFMVDAVMEFILANLNVVATFVVMS